VSNLILVLDLTGWSIMILNIGHESHQKIANPLSAICYVQCTKLTVLKKNTPGCMCFSSFLRTYYCVRCVNRNGSKTVKTYCFPTLYHVFEYYLLEIGTSQKDKIVAQKMYMCLKCSLVGILQVHKELWVFYAVEDAML
jgi:hypothetical protein